MLISVSVPIPIEKPDLRDNVRQIFELVEQKTSQQDQTTLHITFSVGKDFDVIRKMAEALPPEARGFSFSPMGGKQERLTAQEFLEKLPQVRIVSFGGSKDPIELLLRIQKPDSALFADYQGRLTDHLTYADAKQLIMKLLDVKPRAQKLVTFWLTLDNVAWKGLAPRAEGGISFSENGRSRRSSIYASLEFKGASIKEPAVLQMIHDVTEQTQIAFATSKLYARPDPDEVECPTLEELLPIDVAFEEAVARTIEETKSSEFDWRSLPGLFDSGMMLTSGIVKRVPIPTLKPNPLVRAWFKQEFPGWKSVSPQNEWLRFRKSLSDDLDMLVTFEFDPVQHQYGFAPHFGIKIKTGKMTGWLWKVPLFRFLQRYGYPFWSFGTLEELELALPPIAVLLHTILPTLEAQLLRWLTPLPTEISNSVVQRGAVTAQDVYQEALMYARLWCAEAKLKTVRVGWRHPGASGSPNRYHIVDAIVSGIDFNGRLNRYGDWTFHFSGLPGENYMVTIPSVGSAQYGACTNRYSPLGTLEAGWIDIDEAIQIAEIQGGNTARLQATRCFRALYNLCPSSHIVSRPHWEISYLLVTERGRNDFNIAIDAYSGEPLRKW